MAPVRQMTTQRQWGIRAPRIIARVLLYALLVFFAFFFVFPFYTMSVGSFMDDTDLFSKHPNFWPRRGFDFDAYVDLMELYNFWRPLVNSFYMAAVRTLGVLFFCSLAGFAFAKRRFPGRDKLMFVMLATMMLPYQATIIPWYLLMVKVFRWTDTYWPFWIPAWANAFGIFLMRQFISASVPDEMLEAATIDGCSVFGAFIRIVVPIIAPALSVLAILTFVRGWNEFLGPLLILSSSEKFTAPLALVAFAGSQRYGPRYAMLFAGSTLSTLPLLVVFFGFQRQLIAGIMSGAIKGAA